MGNSIFIVWRESVEAMLVIGILYTWLKRHQQDGKGLRALSFGILAGVLLAGFLAWAMLAAQGELSGQALEWFQTAIMFVAAALIVQMVLWMQSHGRAMKQSLEQELLCAFDRSGVLGIAAVAALAIAREGAETVIFLYGIALEDSAADMALGAALGFALALATAGMLSRGLRFLNYRQFFRVSGFLLLLFAAALLATGIERVIGMGWLPPLLDTVWDSSRLIDDNRGFGALLSSFTGYRARPSLMLLLIYVSYWMAVWLAQRKSQRHA
jgi:high-affinity iron transporter